MDRIAVCADLLADVPFEVMLHKITEENGEVADARIGMLGANPRKGVYATRDDLEKELLDTALTAMVAFTHSRRDRGRICNEPNSFLLRHAETRAERHRAEVGRDSMVCDVCGENEAGGCACCRAAGESHMRRYHGDVA